jgi:predicted  nucleic acid-binding Zn-ribbon protein
LLSPQLEAARQQANATSVKSLKKEVAKLRAEIKSKELKSKTEAETHAREAELLRAEAVTATDVIARMEEEATMASARSEQPVESLTDDALRRLKALISHITPTVSYI